MKQRGALTWFTDLYPVWLIAFAAVGLVRPETLTWFKGPWVVGALALVMLGMGFTLTIDDFRRLLKMPGSVAVGLAAHYTIMPLSGWLVAKLLRLDPGFAVGLILVASCPSGTASNVISYLARANVALAVVVTMASTLVAFVMTPLWCKALAGAYVPVDALDLSLTTLKIAVVPVLVGVFCNWRFPKSVAKVSRYGPVVSVTALMFITGSIVAMNADAVIDNAASLAVAAILLHVLGFGVGYAVAKALRYPEQMARTISIEVGMQNGGLAAVLARQNFPTQPMAAVPAVFSAVTQTLLGSVVASYWRKRPTEEIVAWASTLARAPDQSSSSSARARVLAHATVPHPRRSIYYWKCDRLAAFHNNVAIGGADRRTADQPQLLAALQDRFPGKPITLRPADGQGNHLTWLADINGTEAFVRADDGPEADDYIEVESYLLGLVREQGVPVPRVHAVDASRTAVPFAYHVIDRVAAPDLNRVVKQDGLDVASVAADIGAAVARWQAIRAPGFGPFDPDVLRRVGRLVGFHSRYEDYFFLNLRRHLDFLAGNGFLSRTDADEIEQEILRHRDLPSLTDGCLVHKDLALWNILGDRSGIAAFIDWDDAVSGDPMDDLSLLGCFYDGPVLARALDGYSAVRPLPPDYRRRFWLHLLRNMIVKSVIRVGAGYFKRDSSFFLIGAGASGTDLRSFTLARLAAAREGLKTDKDIALL